MSNSKEVMNTNGKTEPLISIVTVCLNASAHIENTFNSVRQQTFDNIEYIVIDGGSTDGTLDIIRNYDEDITYWQTESDKGIADAMNKGVNLAKGEFILFLHADDFLCNKDSLNEVVSAINTFPDYDIYSFNILFGSDHAKKTLSPRGFNFWLNIKTGLHHQGTLCKRTLFDSVGLFNEKYKIAMDYDWFLRAYRLSVNLKTIPVTVSVISDAGISSRGDWSTLSLRLQEEKQIHFNNSSNIVLDSIYTVWWVLYSLYKRIVS